MPIQIIGIINTVISHAYKYRVEFFFFTYSLVFRKTIVIYDL